MLQKGRSNCGFGYNVLANGTFRKVGNAELKFQYFGKSSWCSTQRFYNGEKMIPLLCLIAVIVATYLVAKTAKDTGRNAVLWGLMTLGVGLGFQLVIPMLIGIILGVVLILTGTPVDQIEGALSSGELSIIGILCLFLSFIGIWLIMKQVSKIPEDGKPILVSPPPPPPTF